MLNYRIASNYKTLIIKTFSSDHPNIKNQLHFSWKPSQSKKVISPNQMQPFTIIKTTLRKGVS